MGQSEKKFVEVCFSPGQYHLYRGGFEIAVVIDVLRATSAICAAMEYGVEKIIPVSNVEEARAYQAQGYLAGAERGGKIVDGFDFGNSPFVYMNPEMKGKTIVLTTTNGTHAINLVSNTETVVIGSLNNLNAICKWLHAQKKNVLILASGWQDKFNLEDTICAGAIADFLIKSGDFKADEDSTVAAKYIYRSAQENLFGYLKASSHRKRLRNMNLNEDVKFCLTPNNLTAIPILIDGAIVKLQHETKTT